MKRKSGRAKDKRNERILGSGGQEGVRKRPSCFPNYNERDTSGRIDQMGRKKKRQTQENSRPHCSVMSRRGCLLVVSLHCEKRKICSFHRVSLADSPILHKPGPFSNVWKWTNMDMCCRHVGGKRGKQKKIRTGSLLCDWDSGTAPPTNPFFRSNCYTTAFQSARKNPKLIRNGGL